MRRAGSVLITFILQYIVLSLATEEEPVPIFISEIDMFLQTEHNLVQESSVFNCAKRCAVTTGCKSINYKKDGTGNSCYLNKKNRRETGEAAVQVDSNFVHYDIDYHTQRSQKAEFGTANIDMPTVPSIVPGICDSNPCQNSGTCVEVSGENNYTCSCTDAFTGTNCEQAVPPTTPQPPGPCDSNPCQNGGICSVIGNAFQCSCANAFTGDRCGQTFSDFELLFRDTDTLSYVELPITYDLWFVHMTACAWLYTPEIEHGGTMTVMSMMTLDSGVKKVITEQIDGQGGFYFSFGAHKSDHPGHFSSMSFKDQWVLLCVRFQRDNQPYIEATMNVALDSSATSSNFSFANVKMTKVVIGRDQDKSGNVINTHPFEGKISAVNIWQGILDDSNTQRLYNTGEAYYNPVIIWPSFGNSANRVGNVQYISISGAGRNWREIGPAEIGPINTTANVVAVNGTDVDGLFIDISHMFSLVCGDQESAPVDGVFIPVQGNWKRITFQQEFLETQQCYGIFGSVPSWVTGLPDPGIEEFDPNQDLLEEEQYLGANVDEYSGVNTLCGVDHFWMVNSPAGNTPVAQVSLRRKQGATDAGITTYGKCGSFKFTIRNIRVLE